MRWPSSRAPGVFAVIAALAASCTNAQTVAAEETMIRGGTLKVRLTEDVDSLDPHRASRPSSWFFARALHRGLLAFADAPYPQGARPVPDLAVAMPEVDRKGLRLTFHLRDARFAEPSRRTVTANDARASIQRVLRLDRGVARFLWDIRGARAYALRRTNALPGVRALDDRTLEVTLARSQPDLISVLAHPQLAVVPAGTPATTQPSRIAGAGPYRIESTSPEQQITLERNQGWDGSSDPVRAANVDRIEASVVDGAARANQDVATGKADVVVEPGAPDAAAEPPKGARVATVAGSCVRYAFADPAAVPRNAGRAIERAAAASGLRRDGPTSVAATQLLPPVSFGNVAAGAHPPTASAPRFSTTLVVGTSERDRREARALVRALGRAGVSVSLRTVPQALLPALYAAGRAPMGIATWCADWPGLAGRDVLGALTGDPARVGPGCGRAEASIRRIMRTAAVARDPVRRWRDADLAVQRSCLVVPLSWPVERIVLSERLRGFSGAPMFPRGDPAGLWLAS